MTFKLVAEFTVSFLLLALCKLPLRVVSLLLEPNCIAKAMARFPPAPASAFALETNSAFKKLVTLSSLPEITLTFSPKTTLAKASLILIARAVAWALAVSLLGVSLPKLGLKLILRFILFRLSVSDAISTLPLSALMLISSLLFSPMFILL